MPILAIALLILVVLPLSAPAEVTTSSVAAAIGPVDFRLMELRPLPRPTQMHGSAVVGNRLYVFGGEIEGVGWSNKALSAEIGTEGQLGPWREERPLPENRFYISNSVAVVASQIYIIAGATAPYASTPENMITTGRDVLWTTVQPDGSLGEWRRSSPYIGEPVSCTAACASDYALYVIGGIASKFRPMTQVLVAKLAEDGSLNQWVTGTPLPLGLWFHGVSLQDDRLYVWGGLPGKDTKPVSTRAFSAPVMQDGAVGVWREETPMPVGVYSSAFVGANEFLIGAGGRMAGGVPTGEIWYARLSQSQVEQWTSLKSDLIGRMYAGVALDKVRGFVFLTGGMFRVGTTVGSGKISSIVQGFKLEQPPEKRLASLAQVIAAPSAAARPGVADAADLAAYPRVIPALAEARASGRQLLVIFYSPQVPRVRHLVDEVLVRPEFKAAAAPFSLAAADVSGTDSALMQQFAVYRVPAMAIFSPDGQLIRKTTQVSTLEEVQAFLGGPK